MEKHVTKSNPIAKIRKAIKKVKPELLEHTLMTTIYER